MALHRTGFTWGDGAWALHKWWSCPQVVLPSEPLASLPYYPGCRNPPTNAKSYSTHLPFVAHVYVSELGQHGFICPNIDLLSNGPLGTNFSEIQIKIHNLSFMKCIWKCCLRNDGRRFYWMKTFKFWQNIYLYIHFVLQLKPGDSLLLRTIFAIPRGLVDSSVIEIDTNTEVYGELATAFDSPKVVNKPHNDQNWGINFYSIVMKLNQWWINKNWLGKCSKLSQNCPGYSMVTYAHLRVRWPDCFPLETRVATTVMSK